MSTYPKYIVFCVCLYSHLSFAQVFTLNLSYPSDFKKTNQPEYRKKFIGREAALKEINVVIVNLQAQGYLLAQVDSLAGDSIGLQGFINPGLIYQTASLKMGNLNPDVASRLGISEKLYLNKHFKYNELARLFNKIITYYENSGYPFASAGLDSVIINNNQVSAVLDVQKNRLFKLDSVKIIGSARINNDFIYRYLSIKPGMAYNEQLIAAIDQKLVQLPFISATQPVSARLSDKSNKLLLFLDKKNASQFDGIVGVLPDANTNKTILTGDVKLKLVNGVLKNGETFDLEWRRLKSQTLDFNGKLIYPFLFGSPVGSEYHLKIYRLDTTFIEIHNNAGLHYYFNGLNYFKVFYKQRNTNLISTSAYKNTSVLPAYADIQTQSYGLGMFYEKLDYRFNPRKGVYINLNAQTGNRQIKRNPAINELAYQDLLLRSVQYQLDGEMALYLPLRGLNILKMGLRGASVFGNSVIYRNELFRIGGLKTLRGFDEESIFTSTYVIPTIEYRFLFAQNSHILLFAEGAWYENNSNKQYINDTPMSLGAGINFETRAGILSINYGIGNQFGNGFDPRSGKIHFGLTALF